jgi:hypothetical protein
MRPLFAEAYSDERGWFIDELLNEEPRKTGWMRAEAAGDPGPYRKQELLGRDRWTQTSQRDLVRDYVAERLGDESALLVVRTRRRAEWRDNTPARPEGSRIVRWGVRDLCVASRGHAFMDRALCLPKS